MPSQQQNVSPEQNKQIVQRFIEDCWNQGKLDMVPELFTENCRLHDPVFPSLTSGSQNMRNHVENCRKAFPDLRFSIDDTIAERDEVVIHWTANGTHQGEFLGMSPTDRKATVSGTSIYKLDKSRIVEEWSHWNLMTMMEQLGVSPRAEVKQHA